MKKLIIAILVSMLAIQTFAKQICMQFNLIGAASEIQKVIDAGYKVVEMTATNYTVFVVFEDEN